MTSVEATVQGNGIGARPGITFPDWLRGDEHAPTTSNVHGGSGAFQRWYRFKEAFSPQFVVEVVQSLGFHPSTCTDPFSGSGTTALTCQFLGVRPTTIEVNPFLADVAEAKLASYDGDRLIASRAALARRIAACTSEMRRNGRHFPGAPDTFVEPGRGDRWVFDAEVAARVAAYRDAIAEEPYEAHRRLFRVLLGAVVVPVSNVVISGKGRRYRGTSARQQASPLDVDRLFEEGFQRALYDVCRYGQRACSEYTLLRGDSRTLLSTSEPADLVLFSPPYPNSFDYTDIYNVELWALGYLTSAHDNRVLREATLRSHVQIKRDFGEGDLGSKTLAETLKALDRARDSLWNPHIHAMIRAYAEDMRTVLASAARILTSRGRVVMVVGDSQYAGVRVDVPQIIKEIAPSAGLVCEHVREVRAMRASAQQGGDLSLGEFMLRLRKA